MQFKISLNKHNLCFYTGICPTGYTFMKGDFVGSHQNLAVIDVHDIAACASKCTGNLKCQSIEWSESKKDAGKNCVLLKADATNGPKWMDVVFCKK